jgi:hypothetical protein
LPLPAGSARTATALLDEEALLPVALLKLELLLLLLLLLLLRCALCFLAPGNGACRAA